ncbi:MAG: hypothetical protein LBG72_04350 [Spirochaetaceae bacterium]|nr:hypothetical protein [Spirochaetaceae bacterium]
MDSGQWTAKQWVVGSETVGRVQSDISNSNEDITVRTDIPAQTSTHYSLLTTHCSRRFTLRAS